MDRAAPAVAHGNPLAVDDAGDRRVWSTEGVLAPGDAHDLAAAYRFCEVTRNRLCLVAGTPLDALPPQGSTLLRCLARSLETTPSDLREDYRRVTRRARRVVDRLVDRLFYDR